MDDRKWFGGIVIEQKSFRDIKDRNIWKAVTAEVQKR